VSRKPGLLFAATVAAFAFCPSRVSAQAFTLPQGICAVTLAWQYVDNTGHRLSDGFLRRRVQSVTTSVLLEVEYGITDRLSASAGIPYVFAKYTGVMPAPSELPVDTCGCWHSGFQDFAFTARYRLGTNSVAFTPHARYVLPSHDYRYRGEATIGRNLRELQVGASAGARLPGFLSHASLQASFTYSFVEEVAPDVSVDRSNGVVDLGYALTRRLYARATANWQRTHGGLRFGSITGKPFLQPGEFNTPERFAQRDRLGRVNYWQVGGGLSYDVGPADVFASFSSYVWGRDAHAGQAYTVGATWYFDFGD
jgi:hypothetical protein